ncbi:MAG: tyrosine-type recombinase/integrase [Candidatus Omnitrophica bacterium]|nr:tyrosine-type recombinase/integrase [Candidatus Omnitrophota bacterium]
MNAIELYERHLIISRKSPTSIYQYLNDVKLFCRIVKIDPLKCTDEHIEKFIEELINRKYENSTIVRKLASLKSFYKFLFLKNHVKHSPLETVPKFKIRIKEQKVLMREETEIIFETIDSYPLTLKGRAIHCLFRLFYFLGLRVSETVNLNISNVRQNESISFTGKGDKQRILPLVSEKLIISLDEWITFRKRFPGNALFINARLKRISIRTVQRWIAELGNLAGIKEFLTPHVVRRSFATHLLENGADIFSVADLLGHENISTTQRYAKVTERKRKETLKLL